MPLLIRLGKSIEADKLLSARGIKSKKGLSSSCTDGGGCGAKWGGFLSHHLSRIRLVAALPSSAYRLECCLPSQLEEGKSPEEPALVVFMGETAGGMWHFDSHSIRGN